MRASIAVAVVSACLLRTAGSLIAQTVQRDTLLSVERVRVRSAVLNTTRDIFVSAPADARTSSAHKGLAVLVMLDAQDTPQFRAALATIRFLSAADRGAIPPMLVVGLPFGERRTHELTPPPEGAYAQRIPEAGGADTLLRFISDELLPWIDAHYATGRLRVLVGHSYGGLFAVRAMAERPELFRIVIAMSPSLHWNEGATATALAQQLARDTTNARTLFVTSGGREPRIDPFVSAFASAVNESRIPAFWFEHRRYAYDTHPLTPLVSLADGLRMAFRPLVVRDDSLLADLSTRSVRDSAGIARAIDVLKSRYAAAASSLRLTDPFPEMSANMLGYYSLLAKQVSLAVQLFRENAEHFPGSANAHDSLGDGLLALGDTSAAIVEYRKTLALSQRGDDPARLGALASLRTLHQQTPERSGQRVRLRTSSRRGSPPA